MTDDEIEARQRAADDQLRAAIVAHADAYYLSRDDEMLNEFACIVHWVVPVRDGKSRYTTHFHLPEVPRHTAVGLFETGADLGRADDELAEET